MAGQFAGRLVPARPDLAADHLRGRVEATHFVAGTPRQVAVAVLDLTLSPEPGAGLATQLLRGEGFTVYEARPDGLSWGQAARDGYVGYVRSDALAAPAEDCRQVTALASHVYSAPAVKARVIAALPFLARVPVAGRDGDFLRLEGAGYVPAAHLAPVAGDFVAQAARLLGAPYLWGGRSPRGLDCSAFVQLALAAVGHDGPRDSDMQEAMLGAPLAAGDPLRRGDLIFWRGHVGILADPGTLLHANAHHMAVASEPLAEAEARIAAAGGGEVTGRRRITPLPGA